MAYQELPVPEFYSPEHASDWSHEPNVDQLLEEAAEWRRRHDLKPSGEDKRSVLLLLIDLQKDFCFPEGSLYVGGRSGRGALEDNDRLCRFIYHNLNRLTEITCTMDTHYPHQIFFPAFWIDAQGRPLSAHREITADEIRAGTVQPNPALAPWLSDGEYGHLKRQVAFYCDELERAGKYKLYLWPPHCLLGSPGHTLAGVIQEARVFHAYARGAENRMEIKGGHPLTEYYSVMAPEVLTHYEGEPLAERNQALLDTLLAADTVVIAGQAASHCVKSSVEDLLEEIRRRDPALTQKVYLLEDCTSSVAVPDPDNPGEFLFDFTPQAEAAFQEFADAGMHLVRSTQPMHEWPGIT